MAVRSLTPARTRLRAPLRRRSCTSRPGTPAARRLRPALAEAAEALTGELTLKPDEHVGDHALEPALERLDLRPVLAEFAEQVDREERRTALVVLRLAGLQADDAAVEVDVAPLEVEHLSPAPCERVAQPNGEPVRLCHGERERHEPERTQQDRSRLDEVRRRRAGGPHAGRGEFPSPWVVVGNIRLVVQLCRSTHNLARIRASCSPRRLVHRAPITQRGLRCLALA